MSGRGSESLLGPSITQYVSDMLEYSAARKSSALALGNRGPLRFTSGGALHSDILASYWKHGFYVFENVIEAEELEELRALLDAGTNQDSGARGALAEAKVGRGSDR